MKRFVSCLILLFTLAGLLHGDEVEERFMAGNIHLSEGEYREAIAIYSGIADTHASARLFYNLGLAHQQLDETGKARVNYERALSLSPRFTDARNNLDILLREAGLSSEPLPWYRAWAQWLSLSEWLILTSIAFWVWVLLKILRYYDRWQGWVPGSIRTLALFAFALAAIAAFFERNSYRQAIVVGDTATLRVAPTRESPLLSEIPNGSKVTVTDERSRYWRIRLENGGEGFIEPDAIATVVR